MARPNEESQNTLYKNLLTEAINVEIEQVLQVGLSLGRLRREQAGNVFSASTAIRCAAQMLRGIEEIHSVGFLHRDVKPSNFCVGIGAKRSNVYLLDFGLAREWCDPSGRVRKPRNKIAFRGTPMFVRL